MRQKKLVGLAVWALTFLSTSSVWAANPWDNATALQPEHQQQVTYGTINGLAGLYYRVHLARTRTVHLQLSVPTSAASQFHPQVVIFPASDITAGPVLPISQPPQTLALVYPMTRPSLVFDPFSQVWYTIDLNAQPSLPAGDTLLAVYNAGNQSGKFRLLVEPRPMLAQLSDAWMLPIRWWQDQWFAGWSLYTLITPLLIGLVVWAVWLRLQHHQLHPPAIRQALKKT